MNITSMQATEILKSNRESKLILMSYGNEDSNFYLSVEVKGEVFPVFTQRKSHRKFTSVKSFKNIWEEFGAHDYQIIFKAELIKE